MKAIPQKARSCVDPAISPDQTGTQVNIVTDRLRARSTGLGNFVLETAGIRSTLRIIDFAEGADDFRSRCSQDGADVAGTRRSAQAEAETTGDHQRQLHGVLGLA